MNERELCSTLERAEAKIWSCGCPYLALSEEMGYVSAFAATHDPHLGLSNLGRIGVKDCLRTSLLGYLGSVDGKEPFNSATSLPK